jgi:hypothetical protein
MGFNFTDENCFVHPNIDHSTTDYFKHPLGLEPHNYAWIAAGTPLSLFPFQHYTILRQRKEKKIKEYTEKR